MGDDRTAQWAGWRDRLAGLDLPLAGIDLAAFDANARRVLGLLGHKSLRPATKSLRVPSLLPRLEALFGPRICGWMLYSAREAELLASRPETRHLDDLLVAYPVATASDAARLCRLAAEGRTIRVVVDDPAHLSLFAGRAPPSLSLVLELDVAWRPLAGLGPHLGVRRSPLRAPTSLRDLARAARSKGLRVSGLMAYEAQIAGVRGHNPASPHLDPIRRLIRRASVPAVASLRAEAVTALRADGFDLELVNGGGSGSLSSTTSDPSVTEVTAGSAFLCPHLFDGYDGLPLTPAAFFALPVARLPGPDLIACAFGGFIASGPPGPDRVPAPWLPSGLSALSAEGFGEVQTPLQRLGSTPPLRVGDPVLFRHAKAGELFEHFSLAHAFSPDGTREALPTYRGLGLAAG